MSFVDERVNITVTLGKNRLWLDGVLYEFEHPIETYPIENLTDQLHQARLIDVVVGGGGLVSANPGRPESVESGQASRLQWLAPMIGAALLFLGAIVWIRTKAK
ncbi:MAG: hypothetical protein ACR2GY_07710 [Phycisphaerales bacterium]